jgi:hypothetical protein
MSAAYSRAAVAPTEWVVWVAMEVGCVRCCSDGRSFVLVSAVDGLRGFAEVLGSISDGLMLTDGVEFVAWSIIQSFRHELAHVGCPLNYIRSNVL